MFEGNTDLYTIRENQDQKKDINQEIDSVLDVFEKNERTKEDFSGMIEELIAVKYKNKDTAYEFDRSVSQEQVDRLLEFLQNDFVFDRSNDRVLISKLLNNILSTGEKNTQEKSTVSDLTAEGIMNLIRKGEVLNESLMDGLESWFQNIQMINPNVRLKLTSFILNNPGQVYSGIIPNLIGSQGLFGEILVNDLDKGYKESENRAEKIFPLLDVLEVLSNMSGPGFEDASNKAQRILKDIKENSDNYFLSKRAEIIEEIHSQGMASWVVNLPKKYHDENLKQEAPQPLEANFYKIPKRREEFLGTAIYDQVSPKYGVVYNFEGNVDSFFEIDGARENLRVENIFNREAKDYFNFLDQEKKDQLVNNYLSLMQVAFREKIENDFGIKLEIFSVREQIQFLNFLSDKKKGDIEIFIGISKKLNGTNLKENFFHSFLLLEADERNGEKIVNLAERLSEFGAQKVFAKIAELGDLAQKKDEELAGAIYKDSQKEISPSVRGELMRRAHNIISRFSDELKDGEKPNDEKIEKLLAELEQSRIEIDLVASLLIASKKEGEAQNLEDIKGLEISEISGKEVLEKLELINKLREMYRVNNSHKSKEDLERLMSDFEKHLEYDAKFQVVYFDKNGGDDRKLENLVGFMRSSNFDGIKKLENGERYLGAMNIDPLLQKFYFGENFLRETIEKEFQLGAKKIMAHMPKDGPSHKIIKTLNIQCQETSAGNYKLEDGREIERLLVELTKKDE